MDNELRTLKKTIIPILKKHGVKKAGIFGSYARGEQKKRSDVDILVELPRSKSLYDVVELKLELEDKIHKKTDIVEYSTIHPLVKDKILKEEVPVI